MSKQELKLGVVGLGLAGSLMINSISAHPRIRIAAAADFNPLIRERFSKDYPDAIAYESAEDLLSSEGVVDAVYIATPHNFHCQQAVFALQHGKHVIVEKPMALTLEDCDRMNAAVEASGKFLVVGHSHGFDPNVALIGDLVQSGEMGELCFINMFNYNDFIYRPRRDDELDTAKGGGIIFNQLPHQVEIAKRIDGGQVHSVRAKTSILDQERPTEGACMAYLDFESGATATLIYSGYDHFDSDEFHYWTAEAGFEKGANHGNAYRNLEAAKLKADEADLRSEKFGYGSEFWTMFRDMGPMPHQPHFGVLIATCEKADLRPSQDGIHVYDKNGLREIAIERSVGTPGYVDVIEELLEAIVTGETPLHNGLWARDTLAVCLAIQEASRTRKEIIL